MRNKIGRALLLLGAVILLASHLHPEPVLAVNEMKDLSLLPDALPALALSVDVGSDRHAISPYIYGMNLIGGMNLADEAFVTELALPVQRWGGNATTRYNWQNDTANHASDWYFENVAETNANPGQLPNGSAVDLFVEQNRRTGAQTLLTVPLIGWSPKARDTACGFSIAKYGAQQDWDWQWRPDCGNGIKPDNVTPVVGNDPLDTSVAITPAFVQSWVQHLISRYGTAANGGVRFYNLDNEPMLWHETHRDVHPQPLSYDEQQQRTVAYASAIKAVDPGAKTLGPAEWGWVGYFYSAVDKVSGNWGNPPDRMAHGNTPLVEWYLQQLRAYEQQNGVRLLDYLDLHYYPEEAGVHSVDVGNAATQALRLRSTRSLWDPTYTDESWINEPIYLIPRMRGWVNADYPGTQIAIGEYSFGALGSLNGALAQADVLGIFGREGADMATIWDPPTSGQPGAFAFRLYRNYDGAGNRFGDVSVRATSTDQGQLAIYAAQNSGNSAVTIVVINKTGGALSTAVGLAGFTPAASAQVYRYSGANLGAIVRQADQAVTASGFDATFPANSITLFVLTSSSGGGTDHWFLPLINR